MQTDPAAAGEGGEPDARQSRPERPAPARLASPPEVPGYRIEGVIGRGATGTVYRAVQLAVEREVALKVLHPELASRPQVVQRLQREARTMARLAHPHVVGAIDMGEVDGRWWFAMELVDGPSLAQLLRTDGPLEEREALRLFAPLCEALEHLWEHGVVHRDVKPANVLLERAGRGEHRHYRARLADLGLAVAERDPSLTGEGGTLGTPHYIAPEQARDPRGVDVRSDLWALGATLFHAVCGRPPFDGSSAAEVVAAVLHQPIPDPRRLRPGLSPGLALVLRKCLVRDPGRRYQTPDELLSDLDLLRERRSPRVQRADLDPLERDPRPWRRPGPWLLTGGLAAAAATALLWPRPAEPGGGDSGRGSQVSALLAPTRALLVAAADEPRLYLEALSQVDGAREAAGAVGGAFEWSELRRSVVRGLAGEVEELRRDLSTRVDQALAARDQASALAELDAFDGAVVARVGVDVAALPPETRLPLERFVDGLRERVESQLDARVDAASRAALVHFEQLVAPEVERLLEAERWRTAHAALDVGPAGVLAAAGLSSAGLTERALAVAAAPVLDRMALRRGALNAAWIERQRGLRNHLRLEAQALEETTWPAVPPDPAEALPRALEAELERLGLVRAEALSTDELDADRELPELVRRTVERLSARLESGAREDARVRREDVAPSLGHRRAYDQLALLWSQLEQRLGAVPDSLAANGWARELRDEARARRFEGELLQRRVLDAAAAAVVQLGGRDASFEVAPRVRPTGVVRTSGDPLSDGFRLEVQGRPYLLYLRASRAPRTTLGLSDLERLAGLDGALEPDGSLARVCLRWYEGDAAGAREAYREAHQAGALPDGGEGRLLTSRLPGRMLGPAPRPGDPLEADRLLGAIDGGLAERDGQLAGWYADVALWEHMGDQRVGLRAEELRELRAGAIR